MLASPHVAPPELCKYKYFHSASISFAPASVLIEKSFAELN